MLRGIAHAAIDVDAFGNAHDPAGAIETGAELSRLREPGLWQQKYVDFSWQTTARGG